MSLFVPTQHRWIRIANNKRMMAVKEKTTIMGIILTYSQS